MSGRIYLAQSGKNTAHRLRIEHLVAVDDVNESAQLAAKGFDRLGLTGTGWTVERADDTRFESCRHKKKTTVGQGSLDQSILNAQVLEPIVKLCVGYVDGQLLQDVRLL